MRQELRDTQLYSGPGDLLYCPGAEEVLSRDEVMEATGAIVTSLAVIATRTICR